MNRNDLQAEADEIVREARQAALDSGDPMDAAIADAIAAVAAQPGAENPRRKLKSSHAARKRKAFKHCVRLDAEAPILAQVRDIVR